MLSTRKIDNGLFIQKYEKSSVMSACMCTKKPSGPIISWSTKWMNVFRLYPTSDTKQYKLMR